MVCRQRSDHYLEKWALAAAAYRVVSGLAPSPEYVKAVTFSQAAAPHCLVVSIHKWSERAGSDVIHTLLSHYLTISCVIVVGAAIWMSMITAAMLVGLGRGGEMSPGRMSSCRRGDAHGRMDRYQLGA